MQPISVRAPAKLNLFLHITGQREDGYHNLQTVFQFLDFYDELCFQVLRDGDIRLTPHLLGVKPSENLIIRAAQLLKQETGCRLGVDITLQKKLPMGGGIGGGSSDAAATLVALNQLWGLNLSQQELIRLGLKLGVDVAIFIYGKAAWAEGIGEVFEPILLPQHWYVLVIPNCCVRTEKLYQDPRLVRNKPAMSIEQFQYGVGENVFEPLVRADYPMVSQALEWLGQYAPARLTGSGGCVFAAFDSQAEAEKIAHLVPRPLRAVVARGLNQSPLYLTLRQKQVK